jgi:hypothetical protein
LGTNTKNIPVVEAPDAMTAIKMIRSRIGHSFDQRATAVLVPANGKLGVEVD